MAKKPKNLLERFTQQQLLAALLIIVAVGGLVYWRYYSANPPSALFSSANEEPAPHWPHPDPPFKLKLLNSSDPSVKWSDPLNFAISDWSQANSLFYAEQRIPHTTECDFYPEVVHFCSWSEPDGWIAIAGYIYWTDSGHISTGAYYLNDYYFHNYDMPQSNTDEARNFIQCLQLGWLTGMPFRYNEKPGTTSCMQAAWGWPETVERQSPDRTDIRNLKRLYSNHTHKPGSSSISYKVPQANEFWIQRQFGELVRSVNGGQYLVYSLDLGDGASMNTIVLTQVPGTTKLNN
ncbi:MAG TPA: hypothetical protein PKD79_01745 [Candidatus Doudnabacteria bacterium]|nr:hypothetical protein [Candidatus Doudnabacteria bacterium]